MEAEAGYFIDDPSGVSRWFQNIIVFFSGIATVLFFMSIGFSFRLPTLQQSRRGSEAGEATTRGPRRVSSNYLFIVQLALNMAFFAIFFWGWWHVKPRQQYTYLNGSNRTAQDEWISFSFSLSFGFLVELAYLGLNYAQQWMDRYREVSMEHRMFNPCAFCHRSRLALYLLMLSGDYLTAADRNLSREYKFEYRGPMRITGVGEPYSMGKVSKYETDLFDVYPCLAKQSQVLGASSDLWLEQAYVVVDLEIGWGKQWGCKDDIDRWNTNWPRWFPCATLICSSQGSGDASTSCPCYEDEVSAIAATSSCVEESFNLTAINEWKETKGNNQQVDEDQYGFDTEQPPWEDASWPTVERYGRCDGNVGTSMDIPYIEEGIALGEQCQTFATITLVLCALIVISCCCFRRTSATRVVDQGSTVDTASASGQLWKRLFEARSTVGGETIYIAERHAMDAVQEGQEVELASRP